MVADERNVRRRHKDRQAAEKLEDELSRADVVTDNHYPGDAACMGSTVGFVDLTTGIENEVTLVYPRDANVEDMKISVLTPMGSALIGMRVGGTIELVRDVPGVATLRQPGQPVHDVALPRRNLRDCLADELRRLDPDELYGEVITSGLALLGDVEAEGVRA